MDTSNKQLVGVRGENIIVMLPAHRMTKQEALVHAAWLVVLAENNDGEFDKVLTAVKNS